MRGAFLETSARHPIHPDDVTAAWLARAYLASGIPGAESIEGVDTAIIGEDRGFTGVVARIRPRYSRAVEGAPRSLVAKFPLADRAGNTSYREHVRENPDLARQFAERAAREIHFYRLAERHFAQIPECYYGHADSEAGEAVLLLEDLEDSDAGDALSGCSLDEARSVLLGLADLHAHWWGDEALRQLDWLGDWADSIPGRAERYRRQAEEVVERYRDQLDPQVAPAIARLADELERFLIELASAPPALVHGDMHLDNVMFRPSSQGRTACIIDWQGVARGPALLDVAGFIAESLSAGDRRRHESELLRSYAARLHACGVEDYPFERLFADYRRGVMVRCAGVVSWLARVEMSALEGRERELLEALLDPANVLVAARDHMEFPRRR